MSAHEHSKEAHDRKDSGMNETTNAEAAKRLLIYCGEPGHSATDQWLAELVRLDQGWTWLKDGSDAVGGWYVVPDAAQWVYPSKESATDWEDDFAEYVATSEAAQEAVQEAVQEAMETGYGILLGGFESPRPRLNVRCPAHTGAHVELRLDDPKTTDFLDGCVAWGETHIPVSLLARATTKLAGEAGRELL